MLIKCRTSNRVAMYFHYKDCDYCINCDWLQYSVMLDHTDPELRCPEGYRIELCQGTNTFKKRALVFDHTGRKILTLLWSPHSSTLSPLLMTVQVANESLYSNEILPSLSIVKQIVKCIFNSLGRVDICCDFDCTRDRLQMIKHLNSGHIYVQRKTEGSSFWHEVTANDFQHKQVHCISWGSKSSEIKVKLYNKSRELGLLAPPTTDEEGNVHQPEPEKPWIVKEWKQAGLDPKNTWRLEFSMKTKGQMMWKKERIMLDQIASPSWQARVFFDLYEGRFVTRYNQGKQQGHHNNDKRCYLMHLPKDGEHLQWIAPKGDKMVSAPAVALLRSLMRQFENEALLANKQLAKTLASTVQEVIFTHGLEDYFQDKFQCPAPEFLDGLIANSGRGITEQAASISKLIS